MALPRLFKYLGPERHTILATLKIRFSPPSALNDPFELLFSSSWLDDEKELKRVAVTAAKNRRENDLKKKLPRPTPPLKWYLKRGEEIVATPANRLEYKKVFKKSQLDRFEPTIRVLCLSGVPPDAKNAMLLWSHYTNGHKGFVLEIDGAHKWCHYQNPADASVSYSGKVSYSDHRLPLPKKNPVSSRFCFRKSDEWLYEKEYRILRYLGLDNDCDRTEVDALVDIPSDALVSVTLGANASSELEQTIWRLLQSQRLKRVKLFRATMSADTFDISRKEI